MDDKNLPLVFAFLVSVSPVENMIVQQDILMFPSNVLYLNAITTPANTSINEIAYFLFAFSRPRILLTWAEMPYIPYSLGPRC